MLSFPSASLLITPSITLNFFGLYLILVCFTHLSGGSAVKNPHAIQEKVAGDLGSIPELGRSSGEGNGNPLLTCQAPLSIGILQARVLEWVVIPFPTQGLNSGLLHCRWILYHLSHQGSTRMLEWVVYPFSRGSSRPGNPVKVSCIAGGFFTRWPTREVLSHWGSPKRLLTRSLSCLMYGQHLKYLFSPLCKTSSSLSFQDTIPFWISSTFLSFIDFLIIFLHLSNLEMLASPRSCPLTFLDF